MARAAASRNTLAAALSAGPAAAPRRAPPVERKRKAGQVLIAAHFSPEQRRALKRLEYESGLRLREIMCRGFDRVLEEYGLPAAFSEGEGRAAQ